MDKAGSVNQALKFGLPQPRGMVVPSASPGYLCMFGNADRQLIPALTGDLGVRTQVLKIITLTTQGTGVCFFPPDSLPVADPGQNLEAFAARAGDIQVLVGFRNRS